MEIRISINFLHHLQAKITNKIFNGITRNHNKISVVNNIFIKTKIAVSEMSV